MSSLATRNLRQIFRSLRPTLIIRNLTASGPVMKDIVRDLYIEELRSYKPDMKKTVSEVGHVKEIKFPTPPEPPIVDGDISSELAAYEAEDLPPPGEALTIESFEKKLLAKEE